LWTRINAQKRSKNAPKRPKTPQNAPKRPKNAQKRPKSPQKRPFFDLKTTKENVSDRTRRARLRDPAAADDACFACRTLSCRAPGLHEHARTVVADAVRRSVSARRRGGVGGTREMRVPEAETIRLGKCSDLRKSRGTWGGIRKRRKSRGIRGALHFTQTSNYSIVHVFFTLSTVTIRGNLKHSFFGIAQPKSKVSRHPSQ
jgi:hypothetical protein